MRSSSVQKTANIRRLVAALSQRSMGPMVAAELLQVSYNAARNYFTVLEHAGVGEYDPDRRTHFRLHPDTALVQQFLGSLNNSAGQRRVALRRSSSRHCVNPGEQFLHVLADDVKFPLVLGHYPARRDPLVAALFGAVDHTQRAQRGAG